MIGPSQKKVETVKAPQNKRLYGKMECLPLWPNYIGEKGRTLGKTYRTKVKCYWEHPWETHWELIENLKGTYWEQRKNEKKSSSPRPQIQNLKGKKIKALQGHAEPSHWLHEISISKTVHHHFRPGLIPPQL